MTSQSLHAEARDENTLDEPNRVAPVTAVKAINSKDDLTVTVPAKTFTVYRLK